MTIIGQVRKQIIESYYKSFIFEKTLFIEESEIGSVFDVGGEINDAIHIGVNRNTITTYLRNGNYTKSNYYTHKLTYFFDSKYEFSLHIYDMVLLLRSPDRKDWIPTKQRIASFFNEQNDKKQIYDDELNKKANINQQEFVQKYGGYILKIIKEMPDQFFLNFDQYLGFLSELYENFFIPSAAVSLIEREQIDEYCRREEKYVLSEYIESIVRLYQYIKEKEPQQHDSVLAINLFNLLRKKVIDIYSSKWIKNYGEFAGSYFDSYLTIDDIDHTNAHIANMFLNYLISIGYYEDKSYLESYDDFTTELFAKIEERKQNSFIEDLNNDYTKQCKSKITIDDIDFMTGIEFENIIAELFTSYGFTANVTKASGDQGIDIIAIKNENKTGIQAKCYSGTVGNGAVQEAIAGKAFYKLDKVMVITNNYFTPSAIALAQANNVILWDRTILKEKLQNFKRV